MDIPDIQIDCVGTTVCPRCAAEVDVSAHRAFETARCQSCKTSFAVPGKIGPYVLLRQPSLTEVGATYKGFDTSMSRHVQVNVMRRALRQDKGKVSAFLAEARVLASLDHRNTARAFFVGDEDGRPYNVTELIVGDSLETVIAAGKPLNETQVLHTGIDLTGVLAAAARIDLVHGDIRPANVVFAPRGVVKLVNFRFAGAAGKRATRDAPPIEPAYASPEHLDGRKIDARSDVFSLGATLFHALADRQPFGDGTGQTETPDLLSFRPMLRQATADVLAGMLQADPDKRYGADFPDLLAALRRALKASEGPKPIVAKLAGAFRPRPSDDGDAAAALAKMREARRAGRRRPPASGPGRNHEK